MPHPRHTGPLGGAAPLPASWVRVFGRPGDQSRGRTGKGWAVEPRLGPVTNLSSSRPTEHAAGLMVRPARTSDVRAIRGLVAPLAERRVLLNKEAVGYYESVGDFVVAERGGVVIGCGALHVLWEDLAEVRTLAVAESALGTGVGSALLRRLVERAGELGVRRLFCLTFEVEFFARHGFAPIEGQAVNPEVYAELLRSYDEGVAEFLDLERVKPNTLGNTRMLRVLQGPAPPQVSRLRPPAAGAATAEPP